MKVIMVMFDSLNRHMLTPYGYKDIKTPNFQRLAEKSVTFDQCWVGSMPCMPARRELHTGRYNFLHRSWGPIEPFDDSMPEILKRKGVYSHLVTDHQHYWEDGGCTYHSRYNSYELFRGQEGDPWKGEVNDPPMPNSLGGHDSGNLVRQDWINRKYIQSEAEFPQAKTFQAGLDFIDQNYEADQWFLQIETFDPHEPFYAPEEYREMYAHPYEGPHFDWPPYTAVSESPEQVEHCGLEYKALVTMCDTYLGKVLDRMDELQLWEDTMLIVNTDHGFLLGEHDWWAKCIQPFYNEIARPPLFIWDPRCGRQGVRSQSLVQLIDIAPTILNFFQLAIPSDMQGHSLKDVISHDQPVRDALLFGIHGGHVNCTDGRHVYMRAPAKVHNEPLFNYTLMPTHMRNFFSIAELQSMTLAEPFSFTKGVPTMKIKAEGKYPFHQLQTMLFDLETDPNQELHVQNPIQEERMLQQLKMLLKESDAPLEQYIRLGL